MANKRQRVLVVRNAFAYDFGGAERLVVHIAQELNLYDFDAVVVSRHEKVLHYAEQQHVKRIKGWWWSKQNWSGKNLLFFPAYFVWLVLLFGWYTQLIVRSRADAVHLMSKDDFIVGTAAARLLGKRVIWTDCADLKHLYVNHAVWYKNPVGKLVYAMSTHVNHVILVSFSEQKLTEVSLGKAVPGNYSVVHMAGKDEVVTPMKRDKKDEQAVIFCATSRLVIAKGILELIDAFQTLSKDSSKYRLWLVGDGPDQQLCKDRAGANEYIVLWGHQDKPLGYLAASDVYMHPTHHEAFSLSLAEAAMLGKPMIATDVGGNPELVNESNGILVPVNNAEALAAAMKRLGSDESLRRKLGRNAREEYVANVDFGTIVKTKLLPMYED